MVVIAKSVLLLLVLMLLGGCASAPGPFAEGLREPSPKALTAAPRSVAKGERLTWGGVIVAVRNLPDRTLLEVLAYPLNRRGEPDPYASPQGRFLADHAGFLEPQDYRVGRTLTVSGPLLGYQEGKVGSADYRFPVLAAEQLALWRRNSLGASGSAPRIGVGVGISNHGGGVGVGIGF